MTRPEIFTLSLICILSACSKSTPEDFDSNCLIHLSAGSVETRIPFEGNVPSTSEPLEALVCASTTQYEFPSDGQDGTTDDGTIGRHLTAEFLSGSPQLINGAYYNQNHPDKNVFFVSMHPQNDWIFTGNTEASYSIDGSDDVMFAPQVSGKYGNATPPTLEFTHLLTWIKLELKADSEEVAAAWGPLQGISLTSDTKVNIGLNKEFNPADVTFDTPSTLPFYKNAKPEEQFPGAEGYEMTLSLNEVAYVLCAPVIATEKDIYETTEIVRTPEYHVTIASSHRNVTIPVDLMNGADSYFTGSTMGQQFTLRLTFKIGNTVAVAASITDWATGGVGFGKIEE